MDTNNNEMGTGAGYHGGGGGADAEFVAMTGGDAQPALVIGRNCITECV